MWVLENEKFYNFLKQMREGKKVLITFIAPKGNFECTTCLSYNCILHVASKKESLVVSKLKEVSFSKKKQITKRFLPFQN